MEPTDQEILANAQPLEFVVLALDMLTEQSLTENDFAEFEAIPDDSGFLLKTGFGDDLTLDVSYDEKEMSMTATVSTPIASITEAKAMLALAMNDLMPAQRRFATKASERTIVLRETWPVTNLVLADFVLNLHLLVQAMHVFVHEPGALNVGSTDIPPKGLRG